MLRGNENYEEFFVRALASRDDVQDPNADVDVSRRTFMNAKPARNSLRKIQIAKKDTIIRR